jgi:hypothetical protein
VGGQSAKRSCAICGEPISADNDSKEHIIPEAIGGRLCVRGFLHTVCNNEAGRTWDAEFARQLQPLILHFGVKRRKRPPRLAVKTTAGEELLLGPLGQLDLQKPRIQTEPLPQGTRYQISARSLKEARRVLEGLKRKHPDMDVEKELAQGQVTTSYPVGAIHHQLNFGGTISGRSVVKSALALAHKVKVPPESCTEAVAYLRQVEAPACFGYYYARDLLAQRPAEMPLHCVAVDTDPETGLVLAYAEYFGIHRVVLCLGRTHKGKAMKGVYAIDPRSGEMLALEVLPLRFSEREIEAIYAYEMIPDGSIQAAFETVFRAALRRQHEAEQARVISAAVEYAFANCGAMPGETLTEEHTKKLAGLLGEKMTPWLLANIQRRQRPTPGPAPAEDPDPVA